MDRDQSIALWQQGKEAWNEWAEDMLARRKELEDSGEWSAEPRDSNEAVDDWIEEANVDFSNIWFLNEGKTINKEAEKPDNVIIATSNNLFIDFSYFIFPNDVNFPSCEFAGYAIFSSCEFYRYANFSSCEFADSANFSSCKFDDNAGFSSTTFGEYADFTSTKFGSLANFSLAHFEKPVSFAKSEFEEETDFSSITSEKSFNLNEAKFTQAPDFIESSFHAPPVLDDMEIKQPLDHGWWTSRKTDARKFRALGKMAADANDNQNAMEFFANEVRAKRGFQDTPFGKGSGRFWWGLFYDLTSNFGRSFWRPALAWIITTLTFALFYAGASISKVNFFGEALYIAIRQGLVLSGLSKSDRWGSAITTLYGDAIPSSVSYMMLAQPIISAVWIFLFFLAMRKHFKIS